MWLDPVVNDDAVFDSKFLYALDERFFVRPVADGDKINVIVMLGIGGKMSSNSSRFFSAEMRPKNKMILQFFRQS